MLEFPLFTSPKLILTKRTEIQASDFFKTKLTEILLFPFFYIMKTYLYNKIHGKHFSEKCLIIGVNPDHRLSTK